MDSNLLLVIISIVLGLSCLVLLFFRIEITQENKRLTSIVDQYNATYLSKQGWTSFYGDSEKGVSYNLHSFDGGKIWYACEWGDDWELKILGEAEKVYPGLMAHLDAWDNLTNYVAKNGPIDPTKNTPELENILKDAKIEIKISHEQK